MLAGTMHPANRMFVRVRFEPASGQSGDLVSQAVARGFFAGTAGRARLAPG